ncbi:MAG: Flp pilus assembly complex ATPase component TadA [Planctomycetaceae bacterium]|nr:Flp pilus assembly complex ATPase component TadA [Planctomycetaceae bacterium]
MFSQWLADVAQLKGDVVVTMIERILAEAARIGSSDVHFQPGKDGVEIRFRVDGVLHLIGVLPMEHAAQIAARLKVLSNLLTYKIDIPQEGRVRFGMIPGVNKEMRISTVSTLYGERVVVRFFPEETRYHYPDELGLPTDIQEGLLRAIQKNSGAILLCGSAGSGKTTTAYALLRELADRSETMRSIVTLEDPIEHALERIAQIEVSHKNQLTLNEMIKYMMRQDPEVLLVGEIRDLATAEAAFQAALTGHLLMTTFHAGSAADAVGRLCEIGIEPFVLRSGISYVLCQRLVRRLCSECADIRTESLSLTIARTSCDLSHYASPKGCDKCSGTGYYGRILLAEALPLENDEVMRTLLDRRETQTIEQIAVEHGMISMSARAMSLVEAHVTSPHEIRRVFG